MMIDRLDANRRGVHVNHESAFDFRLAVGWLPVFSALACSKTEEGLEQVSPTLRWRCGTTGEWAEGCVNIGSGTQGPEGDCCPQACFIKSGERWRAGSDFRSTRCIQFARSVGDSVCRCLWRDIQPGDTDPASGFEDDGDRSVLRDAPCSAYLQGSEYQDGHRRQNRASRRCQGICGERAGRATGSSLTLPFTRPRCYTAPVTSKKGVIGIGVPMQSLRRKPQTFPQESCGLFVRAPVLAARMGGRKARRFPQGLPGTPTRSSRRPDWRRGRRLI